MPETPMFSQCLSCLLAVRRVSNYESVGILADRVTGGTRTVRDKTSDGVVEGFYDTVFDSSDLCKRKRGGR